MPVNRLSPGCGCCGEPPPNWCGCESGKTIKVTVTINITQDPIENPFSFDWSNTTCANGVYEIVLGKAETGECGLEHSSEDFLCTMVRGSSNVDVYMEVGVSGSGVIGVTIFYQSSGGPSTNMFDRGVDNMNTTKELDCSPPFDPTEVTVSTVGTMTVEYEIVDEPA